MIPIETKLHAARTRLVLERPFIGALVLHLSFEPAPWCASIATDARRIYVNPAYIEGLSFAETQFVLAHVALHCALGHFARRNHRIRSRWDIACDYAVNQLLIDEGFVPPHDVLVAARFRGMSAEEIYPLIAADVNERTLDGHLFDTEAGRVALTPFGARDVNDAGEWPGDAHEAALHSDDMAWSDAGSHARRNIAGASELDVPAPTLIELAQTWQMRLAAAAQQARQAGRLGTSWQRVLGESIEPILPWRMLLARYLAPIARDDYSFRRPARREGQALLPRLHSDAVELYVALDTSGSIDELQLREFTGEIAALKSQVRARVTVHACDAELAAQGPWVAQPWEPIELPPMLNGGGGTNFTPVFEWIAREGLRPDVLVYFTDAEGEFPAAPPPYPVIWLVKGRGTVPWGERIQLN